MPNLDYIWSINEQKLSPLRCWMLRVVKRLVIVEDSITKNNLTSYASALTYSSILAGVPVLSIVFAVARGFGFGSLVEEKLRETLQVGAHTTDTVLQFVDSYLSHTHSGVFIGVGIIFLLYTLLSLTSDVETAFNTIWFINKPRSIYRRITDYISVFLLLPLAVVVISGLNIYLMTIREIFPEFALLSDTAEHIVKISPLVLTCTAFILLYKLMPNTHVKLRHTLWPGIIAGLCFIAVQYFYFHYQIKLSSYNAIYGSFAALPLFMLWINISWYICLIGGQLCYANQCLDFYAFQRFSDDLSRRYRDTICLLLLSRIAKRFSSGGLPYSERTLAEDTRLPQAVVFNLLQEMVKMQLVAEIKDENHQQSHYLPAIDLSHLTVKMVIRRMDCYGVENPQHTWHNKPTEWEELRRLRNANEDALLTEI
ncbi:MAG: YihY/virulence factor BrkB family protein [Bacteroidaceae bacterium]